LWEPCLEGAGETARAMGGRIEGGRGETARRFDGPRAGAGDGVSRLSVDERFMDEYGLCVALRLPLGEDRPPAALSRSRAAAAGLGEAADAYAVNGFRKMLFDFCCTAFTGSCALFCRDTPPAPFIGLALRFHGWKSSLRSSTKLDGNRPTARLSRFSRPIHQAPSPALMTSIRSPSMNPRSRFV
jgi:hypothetical protein